MPMKLHPVSSSGHRILFVPSDDRTRLLIECFGVRFSASAEGCEALIAFLSAHPDGLHMEESAMAGRELSRAVEAARIYRAAAEPKKPEPL